MSSSTTTALIEPSAMSNRRQPVRQARVNPVRNGSSARTLGVASLGGQQEQPQPDRAPGFFPGIMHFTDSITALPKEMIRHYTMLKEVEAKIYHPEEHLRKLVVEALRTPPPLQPNNHLQITSTASQSIIYSPRGPAAPIANPSSQDEHFDIKHRELHLQLRMLANSMLSTLDEKNHVLGAAADELERLNARCESSWPEIEKEISEDTRWGSLSHWAYTNSAPAEKKPTAGERPRRDAASANGLAASANPAELEGRYDGRTVLNPRKQRAHQPDSDFDEPRRKNPATKAKRPENTSGTHSTGLGITNGAATSNKRRKIEKPAQATGGQAMDRSVSSVYGTSYRGGGSPRETPALETVKKRARGGTLTAAVHGRKRAGTANSTTNSPNLASSPVAGSFSVLPKVANSPAMGTAMQRTSSTRARQNSTQSTQVPARTPSAPVKETNGNNHAPTPTPKAAAPASESKSHKASSPQAADTATRTSSRSNDRASLKREDASTSRHRPPSITTSARNGKSSTANTPVSSSFPEASRPRSGRNASATSLGFDVPLKRSHKKGGGIGAQAAAAAAAVQAAAQAKAHKEKEKTKNMSVEDDTLSVGGEEDEDIEGEPKYCYCQRVSFGEMVGCDYSKCKDEWFHLECVGLAQAPGKNETWYCKNCAPLVRKR